jgi:hypothetical protein
MVVCHVHLPDHVEMRVSPFPAVTGGCSLPWQVEHNIGNHEMPEKMSNEVGT